MRTLDVFTSSFCRIACFYSLVKMLSSALLVSEDPPHHWECCLKCLLLLLRSLGHAVPRERPCLTTTSSIWHWSMLTSTVVLPLCVHEKDDRKDRHSKLWASPDEGAANGFDQSVPAELQVQNMVILIRLWTEKTLKTYNFMYQYNFIPYCRNMTDILIQLRDLLTSVPTVTERITTLCLTVKPTRSWFLALYPL